MIKKQLVKHALNANLITRVVLNANVDFYYKMKNVFKAQDALELHFVMYSLIIIYKFRVVKKIILDKMQIHVFYVTQTFKMLDFVKKKIQKLQHYYNVIQDL